MPSCAHTEKTNQLELERGKQRWHAKQQTDSDSNLLHWNPTEAQ